MTFGKHFLLQAGKRKIERVNFGQNAGSDQEKDDTGCWKNNPA